MSRPTAKVESRDEYSNIVRGLESTISKQDEQIKKLREALEKIAVFESHVSEIQAIFDIAREALKAIGGEAKDGQQR